MAATIEREYNGSRVTSPELKFDREDVSSQYVVRLDGECLYVTELPDAIQKRMEVTP